MIPASRRPLIAIAIAIAVAAGALLAALPGFHRVPEADRGFVVVEGPGSGEARLLAPGIHWRLPILTRLFTYQAAPFSLTIRFGREEDQPVASREGLGLRLRTTLEVQPDPAGIPALHRCLGAEYRSPGSLAERAVTGVRRAAGSLDYDDLLSLTGEARASIGRALEEEAGRCGLRVVEAGGLRTWPEVYPERFRRAAPEERRLLLVGLDGADWKILDPMLEAGDLPHIARIVRNGARARLRTIAPILSPILWTSIATGKRPEKHGIMDFLAVDSRTGRQVPVTSTMRKARAFWEILSRKGISVGTVGWWATWPAEPVLGFQVTDRVAYQLFGASGSGEGLRHRTWPDGLMLSLAPVTGAAPGRAREDVLELLGRGADPANEDEQALERILVSTRIYHHAAIELLREYAPRVAAVYYEGPDTVAHLFMHYAPPRMPGVTEEEFRKWGRVVERYYRIQDRLLGELLEAAGEGTTVLLVSDHGFKSGSTRPQTDPRIGVGTASDWHRKFGIFAAAGPGIPAGAILEDLSILDLTPTLLALLGLPVAEDMDGTPAEGILGGGGSPPASIATYELGEEGKPYYDPSLDPAAALVEEEMIAKLTALGYIGQTGANAINNTGITFLQRGRANEAEKAFRDAVAQDPNFLSARLNVARALMVQGRMEEALVELVAIREKDPSLPDLENLVGNVHMETGSLAEAEATFRSALGKDPTNPHLWNSLGIVLSSQGRPEEALQAYGEVVAIDSDYAEAINNIGLLHREQGRPAEALAEFERAIRADPEFPGSYNNMGLVRQDLGDLEGALREYARGLDVDPENPVILNNRGSALLAMDRLEEAREAFQAAVEADGTYAEAHNNLGASLGLLGDLEGEFEEYLKAIELRSDYLDARFNLSLNLKRQGRVREQERSLRDLIQRSPDHARALYELGILLAGIGRRAESLETLERAARGAPSWPAPRAALAEVLAAEGREGEALEQARASLRLNPDQEYLRGLVKRLEASTSGSTP